MIRLQRSVKCALDEEREGHRVLVAVRQTFSAIQVAKFRLHKVSAIAMYRRH